MRLTAKLVLLTLLGIVLLTCIYGYVVTAREEQRLTEEMTGDARWMGQILRRNVLLSWRDKGHDGVVELLQTTSDHQRSLSIRWVLLEAPLGHPSRPMASPDQLRRATIEQLTTYLRRTSGGDEILHTYFPIDDGSDRKGCLEFSAPMAGVREYTRQTVLHTIALIAGMLLCGAFVSLIGMRMVGQPLQQLIEKTERIARGDFSGPLVLKGHDELSQLAGAINRMADDLNATQTKLAEESAARVAAVGQLRHLDRLRTVGRLASGVAHELGTPLNVISGRAGLIASGQLDSGEIAKSADAIKTEADRITLTIRQLLDFARRGSPRRDLTDLRTIARRAVELLETIAQKQNVRLELRLEDQPFDANCDAAQLQQVLTNLIVNAIQAMPAGGVVAVELGVRPAEPPFDVPVAAGEFFYLAVADQGEGVRPEDREHLFEPFFTTKGIGEGTGLGLSVSHGIVQDHDGWIDVKTELGRGSCFTVYLPKEPASCSDES